MTGTLTLTLSCPNRSGIVHAVSSHLAARGCDIVEHQQFDDAVRRRLFLRTEIAVPDGTSVEEVEEGFDAVAAAFDMEHTFHPARPVRVLVLVSRLGHCLNDLIYRWRSGGLGAELIGVVSNHEDLRPMAEAAGLPFVHLPVTPATKADAEAELLAVVDRLDAELVVLARYMQILSDTTCAALRGRAINIHHSFLPGFKGAKPYHQAYDRGVKLVGATAHYVTADLDEGPIIEQEVIRIDHSYDPHALQMVGRDAEALALSRAVRWHCQHRVLLDGHSTVVLR
ncbi:formyltetrahydrofolate deformylase [Actinomycetospora sp. NBRC 106378]|uniref:formyltetrahydrofolate deformylase n=1 Tax=Actinomycetospora sp. NBRC 106378 TaxID=3032208 RepID=UPI0024A27621|nr:formyltetrahydrofolate deformylase [Actinomycetospora sp. NBRC 106378]GLZ54649.1 formyltetrahydrofolate deformylase [Actinomycetospora sp. NBRC 106378]